MVKECEGLVVCVTFRPDISINDGRKKSGNVAVCNYITQIGNDKPCLVWTAQILKGNFNSSLGSEIYHLSTKRYPY